MGPGIIGVPLLGMLLSVCLRFKMIVFVEGQLGKLFKQTFKADNIRKTV